MMSGSEALELRDTRLTPFERFSGGAGFVSEYTGQPRETGRVLQRSSSVEPGTNHRLAGSGNEPVIPVASNRTLDCVMMSRLEVVRIS